MLYVFHGNDVRAAGDKARSLVESLRTKRPDAAYEHIEADAFDESVLVGHLGGQGLFSSKYIVFLDRITESAEAKEKLPSLAASMQESANVFIILEGKLGAELKKAFDKSAEKVVECEKKVAVASAYGAVASGEFNVFALASAVGAGEAFKAWKMFREAMDQGVALESILGMLFWKAKSVGHKQLAKEIVTLYHDGHRGIVDLELATERLVLNCGKR